MSWQHALWKGVARARAVLRPATPPGLRVLTYHAVGDPLASDPYGTSMAPDRFAEHVAFLRSLAALMPPAPFAVPESDVPRLAVTFDDGYRSVLTTAGPALAAAGIPFTAFVPYTHVEDPGSLYLSRAELRELASLPGAAVGAHGGRHVDLTSLDDAALAAELAASRSRLEDLLGAPVSAMSYPFGRVDRRVRDAAASAGFRLAGTSRYGANRPGRDPLLVGRTEAVAWDTAEDLALKLSGAWDLFTLRQGGPA